jgi:aerobic-type carbon monoxide dehydrogenase small subunit (CoxS/CutS family)
MLEPLAQTLQRETVSPIMTLRLTVNDRPVEAEVEARTMLLDFLRDQLGLTGAKRSCDLQVCGACTVLVDGAPVSSCCTLAYEVNGRAVETIEGLACFGTLHPIQDAFIRADALQCGFCTPGMILTTKALLAENPHPTRDEIKAYLSGNLCRCTGYWNIIEAVELAARLMDGEDGA